MITLYHDDCFNVFPKLEDKSIDLVLCDMPYGTTACKWDTVLDLKEMWKHLEKLSKSNAAIVLFCSEPFSSRLRISNIENYKYDWIWNKKAFSNQMMAKKQPLRVIENVAVFNTTIYNPQGLIKCDKITRQGSKITDCIGGGRRSTYYRQEFTGYPRNILEFSKDRPSVHPTQKPVALMEYLIKTYNNEGDTVLDFCMGSGTTGVACKRLNRSFIGIEKEEKYFNIAKERIERE